jgi:hypothetical protein
MENAIGEYEFLFLHGQIEPPRHNCLVLARAGVKGNSVWLDEKHGQSFKLRSVLDVYDLYDGRVAYNNYLELIGKDPMELIQNEQSASDEGFLVVVLDVKLIDLRAMETPCGGFDDANNRARLECEWELLSVLNIES